MRLANVARIAVAVAVAGVVALIAAAKSLDSPRYQAFLAAEIRRATGLELTFSGPTKLKLGPSPMLSFTGLSLIRPGGGLPLLYVDRIEARVALLPLVFREFRLQSLILQRPILRPEPLARPAGTVDLAATAGVAPVTRLELDDIRIEDGTVVWHESASGPSSHLAIARARIQPETAEGGPLIVSAEGRWNNGGIQVSGRLGSLAALLGAKPYPLQLKGTVGGALVVARGQIAEPLAGTGLDIEVKAQGDELSELLNRAGIEPAGRPLPLLGPYKLSTRLAGGPGGFGLAEIDAAIGRRDTLMLGLKGAVRPTGGLDLAVTAEADGTAGLARLSGLDIAVAGPVRLAARLADVEGGWRLSALKGALGGNEIAGELTWTGQPRQRLSGRLALSSLAPGDLPWSLPQASDPNPLAPRRPAIPVRDGRILSLEPLPLDWLKTLDVELALTASRLVLGGAVMTDLDAVIRLEGGRLAVEPASVMVGGGRLGGELRLDLTGRIPAFSLRLAGSGLDPARLGPGFPVTGGRADLTLDLRAAGASPRVLAGNLDGSMALALTDATLSRDGAGLPRRLIAALGAGAEDQPPPLRCVVLRLAARTGQVGIDRGIGVEIAESAGIEPGRSAILGSGTIDLRTETFDLAFAPRLGGGIRLRGLFDSPVVAADGPPVRPSAEAAPCAAAARSRPSR